MREPRRLLAIAAASGRVAYAFFIDRALCDWSLSRSACADPTKAAACAMSWFAKLRPEVVVTERIDRVCRKGSHTRSIITAIAQAAVDARLYDIAVSKSRPYANKYEEASALAHRFPELADWLPRQRRLWEPEPRNMIYFEALSLAVSVIDRTARRDEGK